MICAACQHANPEDASFCGGCGASLRAAIACPACGRDNPPGQTFCNGCGQRLGPRVASSPARSPRDYTPRHLAEKILRSRSALEGERKLVTVLFADVKDSTALAEWLDPEAWHGVLDRFFGILTEGVHRFEGTVNQYTGDGIMALFGAPIAHEDHAQRACYAALRLRDELKLFSDELREAHGLAFGTRMGIHSGEVVVGKIGDDLRMDYTAQGHTVALAARMEGLAAAGGVCVSEATARLVQGYVKLRDLGTEKVKGVSEPVRVFALEGPGEIRTRFEQARARGLTRFVGREADLAVLEQALAQAQAGNGQAVGVVAEAGAGKSRLCFELVERCRARGIRVDEAHCPAHGKNASYVALLELLRNMLGVGERDAAPEARRKIAAALLGLDPSFEALLPLVFEFLGVPDPERPAPQLPPDARQRQLVAFVRQLVKARAEREPNVLLVDDAHWIDPASDAFLAHVVEAVPGTRTLVVVNFRPEYHAAWMSRSSYRQLPLPSFGPEASAALLADLLGRDASLAELVEKIHERTGGNPFFIEEVVQSLVESGALLGAKGARRLSAPVEALEIPTTVQTVLTARIDRLPEREKRLLQAASVIGREVPLRVLERVAELPAALGALVERELLFEKALYPEAEYAFQHPLTQEAAYRSQLAGPRARTHAAVAKALEELDADRLDERAALLAHHWEQAGEPLVAARWTIRAARSALTSLNDPVGSIRRWQTARTLLSKAPNGDERAQLELESCKGLLGVAAWFADAVDEIADVFATGRALAESRGDQRTSCHLHLHFAIWQGMVRNDTASSARHAQEAARLAQLVGDEGAALAAAAGLALAGYVEGRVLDAISIGKRAVPRLPDDLALGSEYFVVGPAVWLMALTRFLEGWAGRPAHGLAGLEWLAGVVRGEPTADMHEGVLRMWATHQAELLGDAPAALANARRVHEIVPSLHNVGLAASGPYCLGIAHGLEGNEGEALRCLEQAAALHQEGGGGPPVELLTLSSRLGVAYAELGQSECALDAAARGVALVRALRMPVFLAIALLMQARVLRKTGGVEAREAIEAALAEAAGLIESTGIRGWQPFLYVERAELARLGGDEATWERELRVALRLFGEMGAAGHVERLERELGRLPL